MNEKRGNVIYQAGENTVEEFDEKYNAILVSYFNDAFNNDVRNVSKELNLSQEDSAYIEEHYNNGSRMCRKTKNKWSVGDNCRAMYDDDLKIYEAVIERIENSVACVRFVGYNNAQKVHLNSLMPSEGKTAVRQQIEDAENDDYEDSEMSFDRKRIWKIGDGCHAVYHEDHLLREAKIIEIKDDIADVLFIESGDSQKVHLDELEESNRPKVIEDQIKDSECDGHSRGSENFGEEWMIGDYCLVFSNDVNAFLEGVIRDLRDDVAFVDIIGYDMQVKVNTNEILESRGSQYRERQKKEVPTHLRIKRATRQETSTQGKMNQTAPVTTELRNTRKNGQFSSAENQGNRSNFTSIPKAARAPPPPLMPPPSSGLLLQPDNEEEALACMMSSCYLSGYYAGYYTALKRSN